MVLLYFIIGFIIGIIYYIYILYNTFTTEENLFSMSLNTVNDYFIYGVAQAIVTTLVVMVWPLAVIIFPIYLIGKKRIWKNS